MNEMHTLCHVCGKPASHVCKLCGKHVCNEHYDTEHGICTSCKRGKVY